MSVDVGGLETVYMRDVPPSSANYAQRAGRTRQSAAFVMIYAKLSLRDFTYYQDPPSMISGKIKAPVFEIENAEGWLNMYGVMDPNQGICRGAMHENAFKVIGIPTYSCACDADCQSRCSSLERLSACHCGSPRNRSKEVCRPERNTAVSYQRQ